MGEVCKERKIGGTKQHTGSHEQKKVGSFGISTISSTLKASACLGCVLRTTSDHDASGLPQKRRPVADDPVVVAGGGVASPPHDRNHVVDELVFGVGVVEDAPRVLKEGLWQRRAKTGGTAEVR
jgi:hypothetical protein